MAVADWFSIAVPLLAASACGLAAARPQPGRIRAAWALLALSGAAWAFTGAAAAYLASKNLLLPAFDLRFAVAVTPAIVALALLPTPPPLTSDRLRTLLDGAIVAASLLFISWGTGLGAAYHNAGSDLNNRLSALAHPFGDLVLAVMVTFVVYGAVRSLRLSRFLLGFALLYAIISDSAGSWLRFQPMSSLFGSVVGWTWVVAFAVLGAAALAEWREGGVAPKARPAFGAALAVLYVPLLGAAMFAVFWQRHDHAADDVLFWNGLILIGLVVAREVVTLVTNRMLRRTFDQRLAARTQELSGSEAYFRTLAERAAYPVMLLDDQGTIRYQGQSMERAFGRDTASTNDRSWLELVHPDDHARLQSLMEKSREAPGIAITSEARLSHGDEGWRATEVTIANELEEPALNGFVLTLRDVTQEKALEQQLSHHALHDPLTGLANRALFRDRLQQSVMRAARRREQPAVLLLDIDGLKRISETLGNSAADDVLAAAADRLRDCVRGGDTLARFGADEFAVLLEDTEDAEAPARVAERILAELARVRIGDPSTPLSAGIGIAALAPASQNPDELLRNADTALAEAKAAGQGKIAIFDRSMPPALASQLELEADLQRAIERKEFVVHYQPIVQLKDGMPTAVEALVRWVHPWRGMLLPGDFMLAADKTGAIVSLGRWLLLEAARQVRTWQEKLQVPTLGLAINLSLRQLDDPGLGNDIRHVLNETGLPASLLMLESRESALLEDLPQAARWLGNLKDLGANLAIDDCQSGPATLSYVRQLPVDTIKIDRSFVMNLRKNRERAQVQGIIGSAGWLKVAVIAEGIEESSQAAELIKLGCDLGQGFHFARPLAAAQMFDYLDKQCRLKAA